ncbi:hypothetical protein [Chelativorans intermedius]|uniref:Uncharacterized protein n=1 Tax=Chelativorans intermedius TaxID=515947 RepID=A0ABV6D9R6_9HYPH|nr:hypothetical protein [Chelativorans intermedius]MCT8999111.1 hypothetical protein [Chelativorans intermedius]
MRFLLRLLSLFALAVAVVMAVVDATRSIAAAEWAFTPLGASWRAAWPAAYAAAAEALQHLPLVWDPVVLALLALPGWLVFALLALLLYMGGHRRERAEAFSTARW